jgi:hypothetical protein
MRKNLSASSPGGRRSARAITRGVPPRAACCESWAWGGWAPAPGAGLGPESVATTIRGHSRLEPIADSEETRLNASIHAELRGVATRAGTNRGAQAQGGQEREQRGPRRERARSRRPIRRLRESRVRRTQRGGCARVPHSCSLGIKRSRPQPASTARRAHSTLQRPPLLCGCRA